MYDGSITAGDLAGQVGEDLATSAALKAVPGGAAVVLAKKMGVDTFLKKGTELFRVYGPNNKGIEGEFWTTKDPRLSLNYRYEAGLPDSNTAEYLIEGKLKHGSFAGGGSAKPLDGNKGGWPEIRLKNAENKVDTN